MTNGRLHGAVARALAGAGVLVLLATHGVASQGQTPLTITSQGYWLYNDQVHVLAIIRNTSQVDQESISATLELSYGSQVYLRRGGLLPDRTALAPNEETVLFVRWLPMLQLPSGDWVGPTEMRIELSSTPSALATPRYLGSPATRFLAFSSVAVQGWNLNWVDGEFVDDRSENFAAVYGMPNEPTYYGVIFPFVAAVVHFRDGQIVGADRPFYALQRGGHTSPGGTAFFRTRTVTTNKPDAFRIFTAVRPLAAGELPLRWAVRSEGWRAVTQLQHCAVSPCPGILFDFDVTNSSDTMAKPNVQFVFRDHIGRPVRSGGCYPNDALAPGASTHCHIEAFETELGVSNHPTAGTRLDDIGLISVHVTSVVTTHDPDFAMVPFAATPCFYRIDDTPRMPQTSAPFRLLLPYVVASGSVCGGSAP